MFLVAFKIYDINNDGFIDKDELYQVLKMMVGDHLNEGQLKTIILKTFQEVDKDQDDKISYDEFAEVITHYHY
jgi:serine/threonine-protein phosphatase 2B regulatory subunit